MLIAFIHQLDKLDLITRAGRAIAAKAAERICLGVDLQARRFIRVEGAEQPVVLIRFQVVVLQYLADRQ